MEKKYSINFDFLTIIACLMVVFFHCNSEFYRFSETLSWRISVVERCIVYSAIPIFFMLTGAKLMEYRKRYSTKEFAQKRLSRIAIPFIFWNLFYILQSTLLNSKLPFSSAKELISMFLNSEFQNRYWFFWPLFAIYASIPVLSLLLKVEGHRRCLWYIVICNFLLLWIIRPVCIVFGITYNSSIALPIAADYMMFPILGYLISTCETPRKYRIFLYISAVLSGILAVVYTVYNSSISGETVQTMVSYKFFPSALIGIALFTFIKHIEFKKIRSNERAVKLIRSVSECCMGVWLSHSLAMMLIRYVTRIDEASYIWRFIMPIVIFIVCTIGVKLVKKYRF